MAKKEKKAAKKEKKLDKNARRRRAAIDLAAIENPKKKKITFAEEIAYSVIFVFVATLLVTLVGTNFIFMSTEASAELLDKLYPIDKNNPAYKVWPFEDFPYPRHKYQAIGWLKDTWAIVMSFFFPYLPDYATWITDLFCITYITNRIILRIFVNQFNKADCEKESLPRILIFLFGCLEFAFLAVFLLPISFCFNFFYAPLTANWAAFAVGGFIPAFFIAIYNAFYIYTNYIFNSTIGVFIREKDKFKTIMSGLRNEILIVFLWICVYSILSWDSNVIPQFIATLILMLILGITCIYSVFKFNNWFFGPGNYFNTTVMSVLWVLNAVVDFLLPFLKKGDKSTKVDKN